MLSYILWFLFFVISTGIITFAYQALAENDKIKIDLQKAAICSVTLTWPAFLFALFNLPAFLGTIVGAGILFYTQRETITDNELNAILTAKTAGILVVVIYILFFVARIML